MMPAPTEATRLLFVGVLLMVTVAACSGERRPARPAAATVAPDLGAMEAALTRHRALRFDAAAQTRGCPADQTLGEYVAMLVRYGEHGDGPNDVHHLTGACIDVPADPAHWQCKIEAYCSDPAGESPWHYELHLRVRKSDRAADLTTLACPGAS